MQKRPNRLPPLSSLRGFEAAARLASFSKAASELHITQSAVSHQVKLLEEFLGQPLFKRINRAVEVTDAGLDFLNTTTKVLDLLAQGTYRLDFYKKSGSVVLTTTAAFAGKWLLPRLPELRREHPEIDPWIHTTSEQASIENSEVDIAIWYGYGDWPGVEAVKLFDDAVTPLYSPTMTSLDKPITDVAELGNYSLIHVEQVERREDWDAWMSLAGVSDMDALAGLNLCDTGLALDAATAGQGVVLGSTVLAVEQIKSGALVQPFDLVLPTEQTYYLIARKEQLEQEEVRTLYDWLTKQASTCSAEIPGTP